jgi:hypothetical protein
MKKIMVYSKHTALFGNRASSIKMNADHILFFTVFVCGMLIGCSLFFSSNENNIAATGIRLIHAESMHLNLLLRGSVLCVFYSIGVIAGFSCTGIVLLLILPFVYGLYYSILASFLIISAEADGLGLFSLTILPGLVISCTSLICFCAQSAAASRSTAAILFFGKNEEVNIKGYFVKTGLCFFASVLGIAVDRITDTLFSGLF